MALLPLKPLQVGSLKALKPLIPEQETESSLPEYEDMTPEEQAKADHIEMMRGLRKQQEQANELANSTSYYRAIYFQTQEQAKAFEEHFNIQSGGMFWDGENLAEILGIKLKPRTVKYKTEVIDKKCKELARPI